MDSFRENEIERAVAKTAAQFEVLPISCHKDRFWGRFCQREERGVGGIHRQIFQHDLLGV